MWVINISHCISTQLIMVEFFSWQVHWKVGCLEDPEISCVAMWLSFVISSVLYLTSPPCTRLLYLTSLHSLKKTKQPKFGLRFYSGGTAKVRGTRWGSKILKIFPAIKEWRKRKTEDNSTSVTQNFSSYQWYMQRMWSYLLVLFFCNVFVDRSFLVFSSLPCSFTFYWSIPTCN